MFLEKMSVNNSNDAGMNSMVTKIISEVEQYVDNQLEKLTLEDEDLQVIRAQRLAELKKQSQLIETWKKQGHGVFSEIRNDKELFEACKSSNDVVALFYSKADILSPIFNHQLKTICERHLEARFVKVDIDHIPFLKKKLNIDAIPTIIVFKDNYVKKRFVKLNCLGNNIAFATRDLEWYLAETGVIKVEEELKPIPEKMKRRVNIRCSHLDSEDDLSDDELYGTSKDARFDYQPQVVDLDDGNLADLEDE